MHFLHRWLDLPPRPLRFRVCRRSTVCYGTQGAPQQTLPRPRVRTVLRIMLQRVLFFGATKCWE